MMRLGKTLAATIVLLSNAQVAAESNPSDGQRMSLYHAEGVSEDMVRGDLVYCFGVAGLAMSSRTAQVGDFGYGLVGALLNSWWGSKGTKRMRAAAVDRCMLAHGYRVMRVPDELWRRTLDLDRRAKLNPANADPAVVDALAEFAAKPIPAELESVR